MTTPAIHCAHDALADVVSLMPHPRNPNRHPERQLKLLARILEHQGWRSPIIVSKRSGFVIAGHGRLEAAKLSGWEHVPVNYQEFATEADEMAHLLADNQIAELAEMDDGELASLIDELSGTLDLELAGFDADALKELRPQVAPEAFKEVNENIETAHTCPRCNYQWS
jgi:ParB-like chromosome segregation protein Spo0J